MYVVIPGSPVVTVPLVTIMAHVFNVDTVLIMINSSTTILVFLLFVSLKMLLTIVAIINTKLCTYIYMQSISERNTDTYIYIYVSAHIFTCVYVYIYICTGGYVYMNICMFIYISIGAEFIQVRLLLVFYVKNWRFLVAVAKNCHKLGHGCHLPFDSRPQPEHVHAVKHVFGGKPD